VTGNERREEEKRRRVKGERTVEKREIIRTKREKKL
jgi:hypothetical protein